MDGYVFVYKFEKYKFEQTFLAFHAKKFFNGKSKICQMTDFSGAVDNNSDFDGNTILLECGDNEYVYNSGLEILKFKSDDKIIDYISLNNISRNNMKPYTFAIGEK